MATKSGGGSKCSPKGRCAIHSRRCIRIPDGASWVVARRLGDGGQRKASAVLPPVAARAKNVETDARGVGGFVSRAAARGQGDACVTGTRSYRNASVRSMEFRESESRLPVNWLGISKSITRCCDLKGSRRRRP